MWNSPESRAVWGAIAIALGKLWAIAHLPIRASLASHDNLRYVIVATNLLQGGAPYGELVLARQPGYPGAIALSYLLGVPLRLGQELLYLAAGGLLALAFWRWVQSPRLALLLFGLYALAPFSVHWNRQTLQEVLYLPLTAAIAAELLNLARDRQNLSRLGWISLRLGLVLALFWNTRPEGVWILPAIALCYGWVARERLRLQSLGRFYQNVRCLVLAALLAVAPVVGFTSLVAFANYQQYGLYNTYDLKAPGLSAAYESLRRVSPERHRPYLAVPAATRAEIYAVSPSFRRLRDSLEIAGDRGWRKASCDFGICEDYAAGVFFWALRDAVEAEGFYQSAVETEGFYWQIAREVETACDRGLLDCEDGTLGSFAPKLSPELLRPWFASTLRLGGSFLRSSLTLKLDSGLEDVAWRQQYYAQIARETADFFEERSRPLNRWKDWLWRVWAWLYRPAFAVALGLALLGFGWELGRGFGRRSVPLLLSALLLLGIATRLALVGYIDATSWSVGAGDRYLRPALPLLWLWMGFGWFYFRQRWRALREG